MNKYEAETKKQYAYKNSLVTAKTKLASIINNSWCYSMHWIGDTWLEQGDTHVYEHKPKLIDGEWQASSIAGLVMSINYYYYSDGYKKSLRKLKWE